MTQEQKIYLAGLIQSRIDADNELLAFIGEVEDSGMVLQLTKVAEKSIEINTSLNNIK